MGTMTVNRRHFLMSRAAPAPDSLSMARLILAASRISGMEHHPVAWLPSFASRFTDQQVADMAAFVRSTWHSRTHAVAGA